MSVEVVGGPQYNVEVTSTEPLQVEVSLLAQPGPRGPQGEQGEQGEVGPVGPGLAPGGTTGQVPRKASGDDYDTEWDTLTASDVGADSVGTANSRVAAHEFAADPHPAYITEVQADVKYATAAQGGAADTAVQPEDLADVATSGEYSDLSGKPTLGTAAATDSDDYATAAQGAKADKSVQRTGVASQTISGNLDVDGTLETEGKEVATLDQLAAHHAPTSAHHDDRYYTEAESDARYATAAQGAKADDAVLKTGETTQQVEGNFEALGYLGAGYGQEIGVGGTDSRIWTGGNLDVTGHADIGDYLNAKEVNATDEITVAGNRVAIEGHDHSFENLYPQTVEASQWIRLQGDDVVVQAQLNAHKAPTTGDHDDRYYTEGEVDTALAGKADTGHDHDGVYVTEADHALIDHTGLPGVGAGGGGIEEAPVDGTPYARQDAGWVAVAAGDWSLPDGSLDGDILVWSVPLGGTSIAFSSAGTNGLLNYCRDNAIALSTDSAALASGAAANVVDGDTATGFDSGYSITNETFGNWWEVALPDGFTIAPTKFGIHSQPSGGRLLRDCVIRGSNDQTNWDVLYDSESLPLLVNSWVDVDASGVDAGGYRYFRIYNQGANADGFWHLILYEFEMWGTLIAGSPPAWGVQQPDQRVPDPSGEADGRMLEVASGALVYTDAPTGGSGPDPTGATAGHVWTADGADGADWAAPSGGGSGLDTSGYADGDTPVFSKPAAILLDEDDLSTPSGSDQYSLPFSNILQNDPKLYAVLSATDPNFVIDLGGTYDVEALLLYNDMDAGNYTGMTVEYGQSESGPWTSAGTVDLEKWGVYERVPLSGGPYNCTHLRIGYTSTKRVHLIHVFAASAEGSLEPLPHVDEAPSDGTPYERRSGGWSRAPIDSSLFSDGEVPVFVEPTGETILRTTDLTGWGGYWSEVYLPVGNTYNGNTASYGIPDSAFDYDLGLDANVAAIRIYVEQSPTYEIYYSTGDKYGPWVQTDDFVATGSGWERLDLTGGPITARYWRVDTRSDTTRLYEIEFVTVSEAGSFQPGSPGGSGPDPTGATANYVWTADGEGGAEWRPTGGLVEVGIGSPYQVGPTVTGGAVNAAITLDPYTSDVQAGDMIVVFVGVTNPGIVVHAPTASGLTFTEHNNIGTVSLWTAVSPDDTPRQVSLSAQNAKNAVLSVWRGVDAVEAVTRHTPASSTSITIPASNPVANGGTAVLGLVAASYPSASVLTPSAPWDEVGSFQLTGWNGIGVASTEVANGEAISESVWSCNPASATYGIRAVLTSAGGTQLVQQPWLTSGDVDSGAATAGQVLTADGEGGADWAAPTAGGSSGNHIYAATEPASPVDGTVWIIKA